ncbi:MAG: SUMF1/EgtB/PvdO family nonheme iron enzyme [Bacteroidales bacterium]|jgi:serine/threonine protein kinase|nr:SUMF1/EgtB/PvdO family nonheme iron enzyme [Bacteroidales bacterium]
MENFTEQKELLAGTQLCNGKYVIESLLGMGGFGITYIAYHASLGTKYAIKEFFINGYCVRNTYNKTISLQGIDEVFFDKYRSKFLDEAQTVAKLNHPNIVKVLDIFDENNTTYMVMPLIEGKTLQHIVENQGSLQIDTAINYIAQICDALDYIHKIEILHRDIKPDNIIITPENKAILIDFGSAREFIQDKTQSHTSILTPGYAPLEQYSKISRKGSFSDVYAVGATFYFALTGQKPMEAALRNIESMPAPKALNPNIPAHWNSTILKAMELKPENRYQNIPEFMNDLLGKNVNPQEIKKSEINSNQISEPINISQIKVQNKSVKKRKTPIFGILAFVFGLINIVIIISGCFLVFESVEDYSLLTLGAIIAFIVFVFAIIGLTKRLKGFAVTGLIFGFFELLIPIILYFNANSTEKQIIQNIENNMVFVIGGTFTGGYTYYTDRWTEIFPFEYKYEKRILSFYISKYEVTQELWNEVMGYNPSFFNYYNNNYPVENVSWNDIQIFLQKLNEKTNYKYNYRLPTKEEWECAARADYNYYYSGSSNIDEVAWYGSKTWNKNVYGGWQEIGGGNSGGHTHEVGLKSPNALGLYDMSGNVWEWTASDYVLDGRTYSTKVLKGSCWDKSERVAYLSFVLNLSPDNYGNQYGFRIARDY